MTIATSAISLARKNVSFRMHGNFMIIHTMTKMKIMQMTIIYFMMVTMKTIMIPAVFVELGTLMMICSTSTKIKFVMTDTDKMATQMITLK